MRGTEDYAGHFTGFEGLLPPRGDQTPAITRFQALKSIFRERCRKIIARHFRKSEKFLGCYNANRMASGILGGGIAAAIAVKTGERIKRTALQRLAKHIA